MQLDIRNIPEENDIENVRCIVESTGFFYEHEVKIAVELIEQRLREGEKSGYEFLFAEADGDTAAYSCFGLNPSSKKSYDLYWIVTHASFRGKGIGKKLLEETCREVKKLGGAALYAETSGRMQYAPTRHFYESNGFVLEATLKDFYDEGDDKFIYVRRFKG